MVLRINEANKNNKVYLSSVQSVLSHAGRYKPKHIYAYKSKADKNIYVVLEIGVATYGIDWESYNEVTRHFDYIKLDKKDYPDALKHDTRVTDVLLITGNKTKTTDESNFRLSNAISVYEGWDNFQNYIFVLDFNRDYDDTKLVDWDLSDEEVYDLARKILSGEYDLGSDGWDSWDSVTSGMHGRREITEEQINSYYEDNEY